MKDRLPWTSMIVNVWWRGTRTVMIDIKWAYKAVCGDVKRLKRSTHLGWEGDAGDRMFWAETADAAEVK